MSILLSKFTSRVPLTPFFTGEERIVDIEGRVDRYKARTKAAEQARERRAHAAQKEAARKAAKAEKAATKTSKPTDR